MSESPRNSEEFIEELMLILENRYIILRKFGVIFWTGRYTELIQTNSFLNILCRTGSA